MKGVTGGLRLRFQFKGNSHLQTVRTGKCEQTDTKSPTSCLLLVVVRLIKHTQTRIDRFWDRH